ncbi:MAG: YfiR family protein [candidate division Zixibacteria bacterium]|nr:YfiR family protein [candidate division Zixibacteria bacterium]
MKKVLAIALILLLTITIGYADEADNDVAFKAGFIISLLDNVEWPNDGSDTAIIAIFGSSPITEKLDSIVAKRTVDQPPVVIRSFTSRNDLSQARILYLPSPNLKVLASVLKRTNRTNVLTVSDNPDFARYGVMINFYRDEDDSTVTFEYNKMALKISGLRVDPKLLENARKI